MRLSFDMKLTFCVCITQEKVRNREESSKLRVDIANDVITYKCFALFNLLSSHCMAERRYGELLCYLIERRFSAHQVIDFED